MAEADAADSTNLHTLSSPTDNASRVKHSTIDRAALVQHAHLALQQWYREVAPFLHVLERTGREVARLTEQMGQAVRLLQARPEWSTNAADELERAERETVATLERIRSARAGYAALPATE
jgi:hypothetical protein